MTLKLTPTTPDPLAPSQLGLAAYYNAVMSPRGFQLAPHHTAVCKGLEDDRINSLLFIGPPGTGKSSLLNVVYPSWRLGRNPDRTVLGISGGERLIQTFMHAVMEIIEFSVEYKKLFPGTRPEKAAGWSAERGLFVTGRPIGDQDASYFSCGLKSKALTGVHAREIVMDDLHDEENSATPEGCQEVVNRYFRTILGRGDPRGARYVMAGRRWRTDDLYGRVMASGDWVTLFIPAERPKARALYYDVYVPEGLACVYSETLKPVGRHGNCLQYRAYYGVDPEGTGFYWPESPSKRKEYFSVKTGSPEIAETVYNGKPSDTYGSIFHEGDFTPFIPPPDLENGLMMPAVRMFTEANGGKIVQAWDTAAGKSASSAFTAAITGLLIPCNKWHRGEDEHPEIHGVCDYHYDVYLLDVLHEKIDFRELATAFRSQYKKWVPFPVLVEEKSSGIGLVQTFRNSEVPVRGIRVQEGKIQRAVNGVGGGAASVQGWSRMGRVRYPAGASWAATWIEEMLAFSGDGESRKDQVDATVYLVTHAIEQSVRTAIMPTEVEADPIPTETQMIVQRLSDAAGLSLLDAMEDEAPQHRMCGAPCFHYKLTNGKYVCALRGRPMAALDSCSDWTADGGRSF